jgi:hypothetical protein
LSGLCDGLITRPEESYRQWRVVVCDPRNLENEEAKARYWAVKIQTQWVVTPGKPTNIHKAFSQKNFRGCFESWKTAVGLRWASDGKYLEQDNMQIQ